MPRHELKVWPKYFEEIWEQRKKHELRRDDRGFQVGDELLLREWDPATGLYTGRAIWAHVPYITRDAKGMGLMDGFVIMSLTLSRRSDKFLE